MSPDQHGVVFPISDEGKRSTTSVGRAVVADALRTCDPSGALHAEQETNWRSGYLLHFRRLVEAGLASRDACLGIAAAGLASLGSRMAVVDGSGDDLGLAEWVASDPPQGFETVTVTGTVRRSGSCHCPSTGSGCAAMRCGTVSTRGSPRGCSSRPPQTLCER